jgi:general stress protein 26
MQVLYGQNTGKFFEAFHDDKKYWTNTNIDSRKVDGIDKKTYHRIVDKNGEDHDVTRVEVRGLFPLTSNDNSNPTCECTPAKASGLSLDQFCASQ